jgi:hypothetical protein
MKTSIATRSSKGLNRAKKSQQGTIWQDDVLRYEFVPKYRMVREERVAF